MNKKARGAAVPEPQPPPDPTKRGVRAHVPSKRSRAKVRLLAGLGFTNEEISLLFDISESTVKRHYAHELRVGALEADAAVLGNLYKLATQSKDLNVASRNSIFWAKVRRRWHEVQRIIHGYDPETIKAFVKSVVIMLRRDLPDKCPACKTHLNLPEKVAHQLMALSQDMAAKLPQSEIVAMPTPELANDGGGEDHAEA